MKALKSNSIKIIDRGGSDEEETVLKCLGILMEMIKKNQLTDYNINIDNETKHFVPLPEEEWAESVETGHSHWKLDLSFLDYDNVYINKALIDIRLK